MAMGAVLACWPHIYRLINGGGCYEGRDKSPRQAEMIIHTRWARAVMFYEREFHDLYVA